MASHVTRNGIDAWVSDAAPAQNTANGASLRLQTPGPATKRAFLWLKSAPPKNSTISSCLLKLYQAGDWSGVHTVTVKLVADRWVESTINWNNQPGVTGSSVAVSKTNSVAGTEWVFDVTAMEQQIVDGAANWGYRFTISSPIERRFHSLQAPDHRPVKVTEWSDEPDAPSGLVPSGGSAVSIAKPVLSYNFHDPNASDLSAHQIQINDTGVGWTETAGFTGADFDTGTLATDDPEYDTSTGAFAGISVGAVLWWSVRVKNADGLWSDWSDPVTFTRITKPSVTLNNPAVSPNNFVSDTTPEFFWTTAGQIARRVILFNVTNAPNVDPNEPLFDTDKIHTTETSWTPPDGIIDDEAATYRIELRVHDDDTRTNTPGDTVYVEVARDFTFREDTTPAPVTGLAAAQVASERPNVRLTWQRSTAPDAFSIWRGGRHIATLDPADAFTSGTSYAWVDNFAWPHTQHRWQVRCRVNGVLSPSPSVIYAYETPVAWLIDADTSRLVPILTPDWSFDMPETGAVFNPIDGDEAVQIVQGQQGLSGTVTGALRDWAGLDAADIVDDMLWMKTRPQSARHMILGAQNLQVVIRNVVLAPLNGGYPDDRAVSFAFSARGGPK
jgi:hypothetical protein